MKKYLPVILVLGLLAAGGFYAWNRIRGSDLPKGIVSGNGRIEAIEIDISAKIAGRIEEIFADEGDFVEKGQVLAHMDTAQLEAERRQAEAQLRRALIGVGTAKSLVTQREAERTANLALVEQRAAQQDIADRKLARSAQLVKTNTVSQQVFDDDRANAQAAKSAVAAAQASVAASDAAIGSAKAQVVDAQAAVDAAQAVIERIAADIDDSVLISPRDGRVQYRVAQPGEVLPSGGRVLNLVDLSDVYMTFFLPTEQAGRVALGTEVRLILDAAPQYVVPASVSFVADVAQFTPKTVETQEERLKLTFRIKAKIPAELLRKYIRQVKTGLPGRAYIRLDPKVEWPDRLQRTLVK